MNTGTLRAAALTLAAVLVAGCASAPRPALVSIDCAKPDARCHEGRFGLTYRIARNNETQEDAVNGTWRWESLPDAALPVARLDLSTVLGTRLASVEQGGKYLLLTDNQGRQYSARDWDDLFLTLFELKLPGQAIAAWMNDGAAPSRAPAIAQEGWTAQTGPRRLRLLWQQAESQIRIDLIPDAPARP